MKFKPGEILLQINKHRSFLDNNKPNIVKVTDVNHLQYEYLYLNNSKALCHYYKLDDTFEECFINCTELMRILYE